MTDAAPIRTHVADGLGVLTLGAAARRNPLSLATMREATAALERFDADPAVRVIVIRAEGPAFSAGHDLSEMVGRTLDEEREIFAACTDLMAAVHRARQPVIAQVQGMALAAGCQLVATCDLAVAAADARFSTPGVKIGLFCSTPMIPLTRAIGRKRAMQMLLTGEMINAETAVEWGLINAAVPADLLETTVTDLAQRIATSSGETLAIGKRAFYDQIDRTEPDAYAAMAEVMAANAVIPDAQEGMTAFLEKRSPVWR
ncbi:enoyl-CoA hydratase [Tsukamurella pulmonis]|uniref:enoyl-CoA hydratase n=1 Tax=Tsukamurella pulmonis TaxID=47312 RepID=UPI000799A840|nr:enoyl-CoA hydratase [Tsukamurella pulmonis]KXP12868.1 enoyl-CoA hydratase [Tsukamurella pulmonis]RDH11703.1 enoyl-CoA hydratase [Tsukamurella pulmonis]